MNYKCIFCGRQHPHNEICNQFILSCRDNALKVDREPPSGTNMNEAARLHLGLKLLEEWEYQNESE